MVLSAFLVMEDVTYNIKIDSGNSKAEIQSIIAMLKQLEEQAIRTNEAIKAISDSSK